jgi:tetratricopeptide (TPR) repeat protein
VFDSVPQDLFQVSDGRIEQMLAGLADGEADGAARLTWSAHPAALPHYGDADLDAVLGDIASQPGDASVFFPVTAMRALRRLARAAGGRLCLLASDLGTGDRLAQEPELQVNREKSFFYLPVDFSVMGRFFQRLGPGIQKHRPATYLDTSLLVAGFQPDQLRETAYAFSTTVEAFGVRGRKALVSLLDEGGANLEPEEWLAVANLGWYDTRLLDASVDLFGRWVRQKLLPPALHREVVTALRRFAAEMYWTPGAPDTYFNIATALAALGELKAAVAAYVLSIETVGPAAETYVNLALALRALDRRSDAVEALRDALSVDPSHVTARGWLGRIELEMTGELPLTPPKPATGSGTP